MSAFQDTRAALSAIDDFDTLFFDETRLEGRKAPSSQLSTAGVNSIKKLIDRENNAYERVVKKLKSLVDITHGEVVITFDVD